MRNDAFKVNSEYLIFKTSIIRVKTRLLVDNRSKAELIDEFFVLANKIPFFKLKKPINLTLGNSKVVWKLIKRTFVNIIIRDYMEQLVYYLAKLDVYTIILGDG